MALIPATPEALERARAAKRQSEKDAYRTPKREIYAQETARHAATAARTYGKTTAFLASHGIRGKAASASGILLPLDTILHRKGVR